MPPTDTSQQLESITPRKVKKMNNTTTHPGSFLAISLTVLVLLAGLAACSPAAIQQADQRQVNKIAAKIADFNLPSGFSESFAAHLMGYSTVGYLGNDGHSHIYLFQLEAGKRIDQAELEKLLREADPKAAPERTNYRVVGSQPAMIMGQDVELQVIDGSNHDGDTFRQVTGSFQGRGGPAVVVFERPLDSWNEAELNAFLASIH